MRYRTLVLSLLVMFAALPLAAKDEWPPILPADLAMKDNPTSPGSAAMILHRELYTTNEEDYQTEYVRIKIFTEEGKKYADIEIPYLRNTSQIGDVKARTIHADGSIVPFTGKVYDKMIVKSRWVRVHAKAFTLPDVQVGSIIEFKYTWYFKDRLYPPTWDVQSDLFTRHAKFAMKPYGEYFLRWTTYGLPPNLNPTEKPPLIVLEMDNIPGLKHENFMPPEESLKMRVDFFYSEFREAAEPGKYWTDLGKKRGNEIDKFLGKKGAVAQVVAGAAPASDPPETRLRKLYARAQQIHNRSYEQEKTLKEEERQKIEENLNVDDVVRHNYGYRGEINRLFVAMARAAGFDAMAIPVAERDNHFFISGLLDPNQFDGEVALVKLAGKDLYLDPGTPYCTFGLLAWQKTGVTGLPIRKDQTSFLNTPEPTSADAVTERKADLKLKENGDLEGKIEITFSGQEALQRRLEAQYWDDTQRGKELERDLKASLPPAAVVKMEQMSGWTTPDEPLRATLSVKVDGYAMSTARRMILPRSPFQSGHPFRVATREHPVYLEFPYRTVDEVTLSLPEGFALESAPYPSKDQRNFAAYTINIDKQENTVKVRRSFLLEGFFYKAEHYPVLKDFFDGMTTVDEQQLVLQGQAAGAAK